MCYHTKTETEIKLAMPPIYRMLTPGPPVPALTLQRQASGRVATRVPVSKPLEWLDQERRGAIPGSPSLETDAFLLHQRGGVFSTIVGNNPSPETTTSNALVRAVRRSVHVFLETVDLLSALLLDPLLLVLLVF